MNLNKKTANSIMIRHLVIIANQYPCKDNLVGGQFVRQFVHAACRQGIKCTVINPLPLHRRLFFRYYSYLKVEKVSFGRSIEILRPLYLSFSIRKIFKNLGELSPNKITLMNFTNAVCGALKKSVRNSDALYGVFAYPSGAAAALAGKRMNIPAFLGMEESVNSSMQIWSLDAFPKWLTITHFSNLSGLIVNSSLLKKIAPYEINFSEKNTGLFPSGFDPRIFYPREKAEMRRKYGLPKREFLVGCTGLYSERKGQSRILSGIRHLNNVGVVFIGGDVPHSKLDPVRFNKKVQIEKVPELLSACDVFVLPTIGEGCAYAIVEAMGCGLPIISSNGEFNDDVLTNCMSIRINPLITNEIKKAILMVMNKKRRIRMGVSSLRKSTKFNIDLRTQNILLYMNNKIMN